MKRSGFSLIELLVVIAIIAILAAITFPVLARTKDSANKGSDMQNMNALRAALQLYRADQGAYPPALLGYATLYSSGPNAGQVIPAESIRSFLYPKRIESIAILRPAYERTAPTDITLAVWPTQDPRADGTAPVFDANGDGNLTAADDDACSRQFFGPTQTVQRVNPANGNIINAEFYKISGYDVATVRTPAGDRVELRYALFWSRWGLGDSACSPSGTPGSALDDPRQLGYNDPPENTIITWNSYFRQYGNNNEPQRNKLDVVLTLGGQARMVDSLDMSNRSWRLAQ